jgi:8-oxo-dGTP pyrophosphatase MutT (NUDIX family)
MRKRPSARLLVIDPEDRVLLFRFEHRSGPLAGQVFWATPGGGLAPGESYAQAACRELFEEVGLQVDDPGPELFRRQTVFRLPDGEPAEADERFFLVRVDGLEVSRASWTALEREVMGEHRWWTQDAVRSATETIWPEDLAERLVAARLW